jgi:hypothetical protein
MTEWTPQERKDAARQIVNSLADMAGLRPATHELVAEAWAGGEVTLCISNQVAIELACQRNRALAALRRVRFICSNEGHAPCRSGGISEGEVCANFCGCEWPEEIIPIVDTAIAACEEGK